MNRFIPLAFVASILLSGCGTGGETAESAGTGGAADSAAGAVAAPNAAPVSDSAVKAVGGRSANTMGRIPVLEYHLLGDRETMWMVRRESFRRQLAMLYERGYRPITMKQMLDKDFSDVPPGRSPVVVVFDDASPSQFSYVERNGQLDIDPNSAVGIWLAFQKEHPEWKSRGVFCMLPAAGSGHAFFGDNPKWAGQKKEWRFRKVKWLADQGFELCNHTLWHAQLSKYDAPMVQEQIARGQLAIDSAVPGYKVRTFALPQGLWPKNKALAWQGSWTDPKTGTVHRYSYDAVLEVSGGPNVSPFDPKFDPKSIDRVIVHGEELPKVLDRLDSATDPRNARFVWGGRTAGR
jgi:hypothetical protein